MIPTRDKIVAKCPGRQAASEHMRQGHFLGPMACQVQAHSTESAVMTTTAFLLPTRRTCHSLPRRCSRSRENSFPWGRVPTCVWVQLGWAASLKQASPYTRKVWLASVGSTLLAQHGVGVEWAMR